MQAAFKRSVLHCKVSSTETEYVHCALPEVILATGSCHSASSSLLPFEQVNVRINEACQTLVTPKLCVPISTCSQMVLLVNVATNKGSGEDLRQSVSKPKSGHKDQ